MRLANDIGRSIANEYGWPDFPPRYIPHHEAKPIESDYRHLIAFGY
jgi:hypothetical protein